MKKIIKNRLYYILFLIIFILGCSFILKYSFNHNKLDNVSDDNFNPYSFFHEIEQNATDEFFKDKVIYVSKNPNTVLVGKNIKELSNGYFDMKFIFYDNSINIYINKLTKEEKATDYISQEYINELYKFLAKIIHSEDILNKLITNIEQEYLKLRNNTECVEDITNYRIINLDKYIVNFSIYKNMLKIDITV